MALTVKDAALGAGAGFAASYLMSAVTSAFLARQSEASVRRERQLAPDGAAALLARRAGARLGIDVDRDHALRYATALHRPLPFAYGLAAVALTSPTRPPLHAALITAIAGFLLVDEGPSVLGIIPPPQEWPIESHVRGLVGHLTLGVGMGAILSLADRLVGLDARRR